MVDLLSSDKPITGRSEDTLGYWPFASAIARGITASPRDGFVIGIQAAWGMGKTSAVNLVEVAITESEANLADRDRTIIARFNPWMFSSLESLASGYLNQVGTVIAETLTKSTLQKSGKLIKQIAKGGSEFIGSAAALGVIAASGGAAIPLAASVKGGVSGAVALASHLADRKQLESLARELREKLAGLNRRIIIVLDDLDRLQGPELRQVLTLVKTFGDLPNVVHLLVYDRRILTNLLGDDDPNESTKLPSYLEKIVQAEYDLPLPSKEGLLRLLSGRVDPLFSELEEDDNWTEVWTVAFDHYLRSPRDVSRFSNALSVTWPTVANEVYPPDLITIELFRIFDRKLYRLIAENKDVLVGIKSIWNDSDRQSLGISINDTVLPAGKKDILSLVGRMFPRLGKHLEIRATGSNPRGHRRGRQIGTEEGFDSFFRFEASPLQMSVATVRALHERIADADFVAALLGEPLSFPASAVLDEIWEIINERQEASSTTLAGIVRGATRAFEEQSTEGRTFLGLENHQRLSMILNRLIDNIPADELIASLSSVVSDPRSDVSAVGVLMAKLGVPYDAIYEGSDPAVEPKIDEKKFRQIARKVAARVKVLADTDELLSRSELWILLKFWAHFGKKGEAKAWLTQQLSDVVRAAGVIFSSMNITSHSGRTISRKINRLPDPEIYDIDALLLAAQRHLAVNAYSGQIRADVETFVDSIARLRSGEALEGF